jgi:hypothetical protein
MNDVKQCRRLTGSALSSGPAGLRFYMAGFIMRVYFAEETTASREKWSL